MEALNIAETVPDRVSRGVACRYFMNPLAPYPVERSFIILARLRATTSVFRRCTAQQRPSLSALRLSGYDPVT